MDSLKLKVIKYNNGTSDTVEDIIVNEDPLEVFINGEKKYFCMRMPGMDYELVLGLLYNEGVINSLSDVEVIEHEKNRISLRIKGIITPGMKKVYASSGSMYSDELVVPVSTCSGEFSVDKLFKLQNEFFDMQKVFERTGGVHASAFYSQEGRLISFAEDVGRHNALDKCMGAAITAAESESIFLILLSSRISFEMIRKSYRTGAAIVAGVSAPTSAAVNAADQSNMTLIGFLRGTRFNVYTHAERLLNLKQDQ